MDRFADRRRAGLVNKVAGDDPAAFPAEVLLRMATTEAAAALGIAHLVGSLETGKRADVIAVDRRAAPPLPSPRPGADPPGPGRAPRARAGLVGGGAPPPRPPPAGRPAARHPAPAAPAAP